MLKDEVFAMSEILLIYARALESVRIVQAASDNHDELILICVEHIGRITNDLMKLKAYAYDFIVNKVTLDYDFVSFNIKSLICRVQDCLLAIEEYNKTAITDIQREHARQEVQEAQDETAPTIEIESLYRPGDIIHSRFVMPHDFYVTEVLKNGDLRGHRLTRRGKINKRYPDEITMTPRLYGKGKHHIIRREAPLSEIEIDMEDDEVEVEVAE